MLGRRFPRDRQIEFYAALLAETPDPIEALVLARELLVVSFEDKRPSWGGYGIQKTRFADGKHWVAKNSLASSYLQKEEMEALERQLKAAPTPQETNELLARLKLAMGPPPHNSIPSQYCEFRNVAENAPAWTLPLTPDQTRAVRTIVECDAIWNCGTNLWRLFRLPSTREELRALTP